jgi:3-dehydroquinate synthetase
MRRDKKVTEGRLHFVLPYGLRTAAIVGDVTARELTGALERVGFHEG